MPELLFAFSNAIYRNAIEFLLNENQSPLSFSCGTELHHQLLKNKQSIVFCDTGFHFAPQLNANNDLVISWFILLDFPRQFDPLFAKGQPKAVVSKYSTEQDVLFAIDSALNQKNFYSSDVLNVIENQSITMKLNERERDILMLIAQGKQSKEIANQLFLSPHTINTHRKNLLKKLNARTPTELLINAIKLGLISV